MFGEVVGASSSLLLLRRGDDAGRGGGGGVPPSVADEFLGRAEALPVYSYASADEPGSVTDGVIQAQKRLFVGASKALGDERATNIFPGKILRRVDVARCALAPPAA